MKPYRFLKGLLIAACAAAFFGLVVFGLMYCWNYAMPAVFKLPAITFWQALAMLVVSKILFWRGFGGGRRGWGPPAHVRERWAYKMKQRMQNMTPEEKERVKKYWEHKCGRRFGGWNQPTETPGMNEQTQAQ